MDRGERPRPRGNPFGVDGTFRRWVSPKSTSADLHRDDRPWLMDLNNSALAKIRLRDIADPVTLSVGIILVAIVVLAVWGQYFVTRSIWGEEATFEEVTDRRILNSISQPAACFAQVAVPPASDTVFATRPLKGCAEDPEPAGIYTYDPVWRTWATDADPFKTDFGALDPARLDHDGRDLWIAGDGGGLARLAGTEWNVVLSQRPLIVDGVRQSLRDIGGIAISPDSKTVAFATVSGWLAFYSPRDGAFTKAQKLPLDQTIGLVWNRQGLWQISRLGVHVLANGASGAGFSPQFLGEIHDFTWDDDSVLFITFQPCANGSPGRSHCRRIERLSGMPIRKETLLSDHGRLAKLTAKDVSRIGRSKDRLVLAGSFGTMVYDTKSRTWAQLTRNPVLVFEQDPDLRQIAIAEKLQIHLVSGDGMKSFGWPFATSPPNAIAWHEGAIIISAAHGGIVRIRDGKTDVLFRPTAPEEPFRSDRVVATATHTLFIGKTQALLLEISNRSYKLIALPDALAGLSEYDLITLNGDRAFAHLPQQKRLVAFTIGPDLSASSAPVPRLVQIASPRPGKVVGLVQGGDDLVAEDMGRRVLRVQRRPHATARFSSFAEIADAASSDARLFFSSDSGIDVYDFEKRRWSTIDDVKTGEIAVRNTAGTASIIAVRASGRLDKLDPAGARAPQSLTGRPISLAAGRIHDSLQINETNIALAGRTPRGERRVEIYDGASRRVLRAFSYGDAPSRLQMIGILGAAPVVLDRGILYVGKDRQRSASTSDRAKTGWIEGDKTIWTIRASEPDTAVIGDGTGVPRPSLYLHRQIVGGAEECWFKPSFEPPDAPIEYMSELPNGLLVGLAGNHPVLYDRSRRRWLGRVDLNTPAPDAGWEIAPINGALFTRPAGARNGLMRLDWPRTRRQGCSKTPPKPRRTTYPGMTAVDPDSGRVLSLTNGRVIQYLPSGKREVLVAPGGRAPSDPVRIWMTDSHIHALDQTAVWSYDFANRSWTSRSYSQLGLSDATRLSEAVFFTRSMDQKGKRPTRALLRFSRYWAEISIPQGSDARGADAQRLLLPEIQGAPANLGRIHRVQEVADHWVFVGAEGLQVYDPWQQRWHPRWNIRLGAAAWVGRLRGRWYVHDPDAGSIWVAARDGPNNTAEAYANIDFHKFADWVLNIDGGKPQIIGMTPSGAFELCSYRCKSIFDAPTLLEETDAARVFRVGSKQLIWGRGTYRLINGTAVEPVYPEGTFPSPGLITHVPGSSGIVILGEGRLFRLVGNRISAPVAIKERIDDIRWAAQFQRIVAYRGGRPVALLRPDLELATLISNTGTSERTDSTDDAGLYRVSRPLIGAKSGQKNYIARGSAGDWMWVQRKYGVALYRKDGSAGGCKVGAVGSRCFLRLGSVKRRISWLLVPGDLSRDIIAVLDNGNLIRWSVNSRELRNRMPDNVSVQRFIPLEGDAKAFRAEKLSRRPDGRMALFGNVGLYTGSNTSAEIRWGGERHRLKGNAKRVARDRPRPLASAGFAWDSANGRVKVSMDRAPASIRAEEFVTTYLSPQAYDPKTIVPASSGGFFLVGRQHAYKFRDADMRKLRTITSVQAAKALDQTTPAIDGVWKDGDFVAFATRRKPALTRDWRLGDVVFSERADAMGVTIRGPGDGPFLTTRGFAWDQFVDIGWTADGIPAATTKLGRHRVADMGRVRDSENSATIWSGRDLAAVRAQRDGPDWPFGEPAERLRPWPDGTVRYGFKHDQIVDAYPTATGPRVRDRDTIRNLASAKSVPDQPRAERRLRQINEERSFGRTAVVGLLRTSRAWAGLQLSLETSEPMAKSDAQRPLGVFHPRDLDTFTDVETASDGTTFAATAIGVFAFDATGPDWRQSRLWRKAGAYGPRLHRQIDGNVAVEWTGGTGGCFVLSMAYAVPCADRLTIALPTANALGARLSFSADRDLGRFWLRWTDPSARKSELTIEDGTLDFDRLTDLGFCQGRRYAIDIRGRVVTGAGEIRSPGDRVLSKTAGGHSLHCPENRPILLASEMVIADRSRNFFRLFDDGSQMKPVDFPNRYRWAFVAPGQPRFVRLTATDLTVFTGSDIGDIRHHARSKGELIEVRAGDDNRPNAVAAYDRPRVALIRSGRLSTVTPGGIVDYGLAGDDRAAPFLADLNLVDMPGDCARSVYRPLPGAFLVRCGILIQRRYRLTEDAVWQTWPAPLFLDRVVVGGIDAAATPAKGMDLRLHGETVPGPLEDGSWSFDLIRDIELGAGGVIALSESDGLRRYAGTDLSLARRPREVNTAASVLRRLVNDSAKKVRRTGDDGTVCVGSGNRWTVLPSSTTKGRGRQADANTCRGFLGQSRLRRFLRDTDDSLVAEWLDPKSVITDDLRNGRFLSDTPIRLPTAMMVDGAEARVCYPFLIGLRELAVRIGADGRAPLSACPQVHEKAESIVDGDEFIVRAGRLFRGP